MKPSPSNPGDPGSRLRGQLQDFRRQVGAFRAALLKDLLKGRIKREPVTGLRMRRNILEWTTLREGKHGPETLAARQVTLEGDATVLTDPEKCAAEIRRQCPDLTGPVSLGISAEHMLLRIVELPSTDPVEMAGMIKLQLDKFSPFPEERMAVSCERLQTTENGYRMLIVAVQKEAIDFAHAVFLKAGLDLQRIDADVMGWWRVLVDRGEVPATGRHILLLLEAEGGIMVAVQQGVPVAMKAIGSSGGMAEEEYAAEVAHELGAFTLALDLEQGVAPVSGLDLWYRDLAPNVLAEWLKAELGREANVRSLDTLPALSEGLARRMLSPPFEVASAAGRETPVVVDLVPAAWRMVEDSLRVKRRLVAATILVFLLWVLIGLGFFGGYTWEQRRLRKLEERMTALQKPADEVRAKQRRARSFEQYLDRKRSALECLREISQLLPADVTITAFQFKKAKSVGLRGESLTVDPILDFKQALDKSSMFKKIDMGSTQTSQRKAATVQTFQITIFLPEEPS